MSDFDWRKFLAQWSVEILAAGDYGDSVSPEMIRSRWLGYAGASEDQIIAAEARLGQTLPPSYKAFLRVSNGWSCTSPFIDKLFSTQEIDWMRVNHQDLIAAWRLGDSEGVTEESRHLHATLQISEIGDSALYLLNPAIINPEGEWEAWFFATWNPGADRYESFQALMQAEYQTFISLRDHEAKRYSPDDDLILEMSGLVQEIRQQADLFRNTARRGDPLGGSHHNGTINALDEIAERVKKMIAEMKDTQILLTQLRALAEELEKRARQQPHMTTESVFNIALDPQKTATLLDEFGRLEGYRQAAGIIRWFLKE